MMTRYSPEYNKLAGAKNVDLGQLGRLSKKIQIGASLSLGFNTDRTRKAWPVKNLNLKRGHAVGVKHYILGLHLSLKRLFPII